jgi:hypothetical protein
VMLSGSGFSIAQLNKKAPRRGTVKKGGISFRYPFNFFH